MSQLTRSNNSLLFPGISVLLAILCQGLLLFGLARWFAEPASQIQNKIFIRLLKPVANIPKTIIEKPPKPQKTEVKSPVVQEILPPPKPLEKAVVVQSQPVIERIPASKIPPAVKPEPVIIKKVRPVAPVKVRPVSKPQLKPIKVQPDKIKTIAPPPNSSVIQTNDTIPDSSPRPNILPGKIPSTTTEKSPNTEAEESFAPDPDIINAYLNKVRLTLQQNLRYPSAARRRNISGTVLISFQVKIDGSIFNTRLKKDPDRFLRKAAFELVERISIPLPPPGWQEAFVIEIPLKFSLK